MIQSKEFFVFPKRSLLSFITIEEKKTELLKQIVGFS